MLLLNEVLEACEFSVDIHAVPAGIILNYFICTQTFMSIYL